MRTSRPEKPALLRHLLLAALASLPLACKDGGCGGGSGGAPAATASASAAPSGSVATVASASALPPRRWNAVRASGPAGAIFRGVNTIELKEEQKATLEKIAAEMREADRAARDAGDAGAPRSDLREAHAELVAGVKAGKIDPSKMEPHYAALEKAAKARQEREADALNKLHAALEPAQRAAIVTSVRSFEEKRAERMKPRDKPDGGGPDFVKLRIQRYTHDLALDADQQKKLEALIPKDDKAAAARDEMKKQTDALLAAFEKDVFDAKKLDQGAAKRARAPMEEQVKLYGQLVPILKPEQRERLARTLARSGERARPHRGMSTSERVHDHEHEDDDDDVH